MAKTTKAISGAIGKCYLVLSTEWVTALASLTTAETIDISSLVKSVTQNNVAERTIDKDYVIDDPNPIISPENTLTAERYTIAFYYTQGQETIGTDALDPATLLREMHLHPVQYPLQFKWVIGKPTVGNEEYSTSPTDSYLVSVATPVVAGQGSGKVLIPVVVDTPPPTVALIS